MFSHDQIRLTGDDNPDPAPADVAQRHEYRARGLTPPRRNILGSPLRRQFLDGGLNRGVIHLSMDRMLEGDATFLVCDHLDDRDRPLTTWVMDLRALVCLDCGADLT